MDYHCFPYTERYTPLFLKTRGGGKVAGNLFLKKTFQK